MARAELDSDIRDAAQVNDAGDGVADGGHGFVRAADAAGVPPEYYITYAMVHLDRPVSAETGQQVAGADLVREQAGDAENGDGAEQFPGRPVAVPPDQEYVRNVRGTAP